MLILRLSCIWINQVIFIKHFVMYVNFSFRKKFNFYETQSAKVNKFKNFYIL